MTRLTNPTLSDSEKRGELNPKLEAAIKELELIEAEFMKTQKGLKILGDAQPMLYGARLQICKSEIEIAHIINALREATKKEETGFNKRLIN